MTVFVFRHDLRRLTTGSYYEESGHPSSRFRLKHWSCRLETLGFWSCHLKYVSLLEVEALTKTVGTLWFLYVCYDSHEVCKNILE